MFHVIRLILINFLLSLLFFNFEEGRKTPIENTFETFF